MYNTILMFFLVTIILNDMLHFIKILTSIKEKIFCSKIKHKWTFVSLNNTFLTTNHKYPHIIPKHKRKLKLFLRSRQKSPKRRNKTFFDPPKNNHHSYNLHKLINFVVTTKKLDPFTLLFNELITLRGLHEVQGYSWFRG